MKMYNVIQDIPSANKFFAAGFSVIKGDTSPAGYPVGKFVVVCKGHSIANARKVANELNAGGV